VFVPSFDDLALEAPSHADLYGIKAALSRAFDVHDLGDATWFLGMKIERDRDAGTLKLSQPTMTNDLVTKHDPCQAETELQNNLAL
jgi:hypothetical protein